ncbi:MAG TPA: ATP-dependent DNA ligase, partial [Actinomycetota bacterium]
MPRRTIAGDLPAPMLATSQSEIPHGEGWTYEPKWDGFRTIVALGEDGDVRLVSRDGRPLGRYFPEIVELVAERPPGTFVADGELIVIRPTGMEF